MKSKIYRVKSAVSYVKGILDTISNDKVTLYAAQASFFVITSSVPFISLLIALIGALIPDSVELPDVDISFIGDTILSPMGASNLFNDLIDELTTVPSISLLSFSAVTTLWTASRGISAIRSGVEKVYGADKSSNYVKHRMSSILTTVIFILGLTIVTVLLLFGDMLSTFLKGLIGEKISYLFEILRMPAVAVIMAVFFTAMYTYIAARSSLVRHRVWYHVPGGLFAAVGWLVFSYFYSLYINNFPSASKVYGGLAAVCLIMLWLYFCMIILLLGAELNKLYFAGVRGGEEIKDIKETKSNMS